MNDTPHRNASAAGLPGEADPPLDRLLAQRTELHCREQLSALLDGALPADEARFLLRRLQHDRALSGHWERWQLYGDALRGSASTLLPSDFAQRVATALASESQGAASPADAKANTPRPRWLRVGGGAALAASVALAALFVVQRAPVEGSAPALELASSTGAADPQPVVPAGTRDPSMPTGAGTAGSGAAAAAALAMAEAPRRIARRDRQAAPRRATAVSTPAVSASPGSAIERSDVAPTTIAFAAASEAAGSQTDPFAVDGALVARPWPRAVLPNMAASPLTVDYGRLPAQGADIVFEPFAPQVPVEAPTAATP